MRTRRELREFCSLELFSVTRCHFMSAVARRVAYIHQENLKTSADALPSNIGRSSLVHSLIKSLNLLETDDEEDEEDEEKVDALKAVKEVLKQARARVVESKPADRAQLSAFHDNSYLSKFVVLYCSQSIVI